MRRLLICLFSSFSLFTAVDLRAEQAGSTAPANGSLIVPNDNRIAAGVTVNGVLLRRKLNHYARPALLAIDEVGYLSYDSAAADLLYEVVNRRYERRSILMTTNKAFKDWNTVFPNATSIATLLDRLTHHADITLIEGQSYRVRESEMEIAARRKKKS